MNKSKKIISIINIFLASLLLIGLVSYAYFSYIRTENFQDINIQSKNLELTFSNSANVSLSNADPGDTTTKTVTITNTGNDATTYDLLWTTITNTFIAQEELVYSATCTGVGCKTLSERPLPMSGTNMPILGNISIGEGVTHVYTFTITYKETNYAQTMNLNKTFTGTMGADTTRKYEVTGTVDPSTINYGSGYLNVDPTKEYALFVDSTEPVKVMIYNFNSSNTRIDNSRSTFSEFGDYYFLSLLANTAKIKVYFRTLDNVNVTDNSIFNHIYLKEITTTNPDSILYTANTLGSAILSNTVNTTKVDFIKIPVSQNEYDNPDSTYLTADPTSGDNTNYVKTNAITANTKPGYVSLSTAISETGIYSVKGLGSSKAYIFRGNATNNNVSFGEKMWKILRINEDGSIRIMLTDPTTDESLFTNTCESGATNCIEYSYESNGEIIGNLIKSTLEEWYQNNLIDYDNLIANTYFCNDNTVEANQRFATAMPSYQCPFSARKHYLKIGLPMLDDYVYSGITYSGYTKNNFMVLNQTFLMSGSTTSSRTFITYTNSYRLAVLPNHDNPKYARPVISLKPNTEILSGNGTTQTPYLIKTTA